MKKTLKRALATSVLGSAVALGSTAHALTQTWTSNNDDPKIDVQHTLLVSNTDTLTPTPIYDNKVGAVVYLSASVPVSVTINKTRQDGTLLSATSAIAVGTTVTSVTLAGPLFARYITISPTTSVSSTGGLYGTVWQYKNVQ